MRIGVAPLAGAWIEIHTPGNCGDLIVSLPLRERGLKYYSEYFLIVSADVAPLAGAWIEIDCGLFESD